MAARHQPDNGGLLRLALVAMPWPLFNRPSIQLGALAAYLRRQDQQTRVTALHPYLEVARLLGPESYHRISQNVWLCEALYAPLLFPEMTDAAGRLARRLLGRRPFFEFDRTVTVLREQLAGWVDGQPWETLGLVGFSVCFNQLLPSLAAAKAIKQHHPQLPILFGGSSCAGAAGLSLVRAFASIDYLISGEGERPLLALCQALAGRGDFPEGLVLRRTANHAAPPAREDQLGDLNTLPIPDYDDYFIEMARCFGQGLPFMPELPVEFSRGCWWNQCAFCNLNLQWCGYRGKDAERMAEEVRTLVKRHAVPNLSFTDNVLPPRAGRRFFEIMAADGHDLRFFAELRASQRVDLTAMRQGGLAVAQAGIEALSDSLLKKMRKGATVMDNVALIKDCLVQGIRLEGNLIVEFPGSSASEVEETLAVLDFLWPFPPLKTAAFFLGHGSPVAADPKKHGVTAIRSHHKYRQLIPSEILGQLVLLLHDHAGDRVRLRRRWAPVAARVKAWQRFHARRSGAAACLPLLSWRDGGSFLVIRQELPSGQVLHHRLKGLSREIYRACDAVIDVKTLLERFSRVTEKNLRAFLDDLEAKRLIFRAGDRYLALAVQARS